MNKMPYWKGWQMTDYDDKDKDRQYNWKKKVNIKQTTAWKVMDEQNVELDSYIQVKTCGGRTTSAVDSLCSKSTIRMCYAYTVFYWASFSFLSVVL